MSARPLEVKALVPLLQGDWESPEALAKGLIEALDKARGDRTSHIAVMQFGVKGSLFYAGMGPYPGRKSAEAALLRHPAVHEATGRAVVPVTSPEGYEELLRRVG